MNILLRPKNPIPTLMAETSKNTVPTLGYYRPHAYTDLIDLHHRVRDQSQPPI